MTESTPQMTSPQEMTPPQDATPPQQPGEIGGSDQQSRWPKIIGIISIVIGAGGCFGAAWGFVAPMFLKMMAERVPANQAAAFGNLEALGNWIYIDSAVKLVLGLVLLLGGIALVRRRRNGIKLARIWAVSRILFALASTYVGYIKQQGQFEQLSQQMPQNPLLSGSSFFDVAMMIGFAFGLAWSCAYPVFVLIWFARGKIKADCTQWS